MNALSVAIGIIVGIVAAVVLPWWPGAPFLAWAIGLLAWFIASAATS